MPSVNLIPAPRRDARRLRRHVHWCIAGCGTLAAAIIVAAVGCRLIWGGEEPGLDRQVTIAEQEVRSADSAFTSARRELAEANAAAAANKKIAGQPDWSLLLALVADQAGSEVVLRSLAIGPRAAESPEGKSATTPGKTAATPVAAPRSLVLTASGLGKSQPAVTQFALRLEKTGLFARVRLLDTSRESFLADEATAFRMECSLDEPGATKSIASTGDK